VIEDGQILEEGSHQELLRKKGKYYNLYTQQFRAEKEKDLKFRSDSDIA
jgi:ATP-binding cassette subfamily B protein